MAIYIEADNDVLANARKSSCMTQGDFAELFGVTTPTVWSWEKNPANLSIKKLRGIYEHLSTDGQDAIKRWVCSYFD